MVKVENRGLLLNTEIEGLLERGLGYLQRETALHLNGGPGTGKTTLAFVLAEKLGRPVRWVQASGQSGWRLIETAGESPVERVLRRGGRSNLLREACESGSTLILENFDALPEASLATLLSVIGEGLLGSGGSYGRVHPEFRVILTSLLPGRGELSRQQLALLDRAVTLRVGRYSRETEVAIVASQVEVARQELERLVDLVRVVRMASETGREPGLRASIVLARQGIQADWKSESFRRVCRDVLGDSLAGSEGLPEEAIEEMLGHCCVEAWREEVVIGR